MKHTILSLCDNDNVFGQDPNATDIGYIKHEMCLFLDDPLRAVGNVYFTEQEVRQRGWCVLRVILCLVPGWPVVRWIIPEVALCHSRMLKSSYVIIIIREICKLPTLRLKALNRYNTHNGHRDGKCYQQYNRKLTHYVNISINYYVVTSMQVWCSLLHRTRGD